MFGNGAATGTMRNTTPVHPAAIPRDPTRGISAFCGAAAGTTDRAAFVVRPASTSLRTPVSASSVFVWCWSSVFFSSESFLCDSDAEVAVALASGPLCSVTLMRFLRLAIPCVCDGQSPAREFLGQSLRPSPAEAQSRK